MGNIEISHLFCILFIPELDAGDDHMAGSLGTEFPAQMGDLLHKGSRVLDLGDLPVILFGEKAKFRQVGGDDVRI